MKLYFHLQVKKFQKHQNLSAQKWWIVLFCVLLVFFGFLMNLITELVYYLIFGQGAINNILVLTFIATTLPLINLLRKHLELFQQRRIFQLISYLENKHRSLPQLITGLIASTDHETDDHHVVGEPE